MIILLCSLVLGLEKCSDVVFLEKNKGSVELNSNSMTFL